MQALTPSRNISTEAFDSRVSISKLLCISGIEFCYVTLTLLHISDCGCGFIALLFVVGILLFSGSLYVLTMTGISKLGIITPFGGLAFLLGWFLLGLAAFRLQAA